MPEHQYHWSNFCLNVLTFVLFILPSLSLCHFENQSSSSSLSRDQAGRPCKMMIIICSFISCTHKVMQALHRYCTCDSSISFCYVSPIHCLFSFCVTFSFVFLLGQNRASWNVKSIIRVICRVSKKFVLLISCTITFDQNFIFRWNF